MRYLCKFEVTNWYIIWLNFRSILIKSKINLLVIFRYWNDYQNTFRAFTTHYHQNNEHMLFAQFELIEISFHDHYHPVVSVVEMPIIRNVTLALAGKRFHLNWGLVTDMKYYLQFDMPWFVVPLKLFPYFHIHAYTQSASISASEILAIIANIRNTFQDKCSECELAVR